MKQLEAVIHPDAIDRILELLEQRNISNLIITHVTAKDLRGPHIHTYRGHAYAVDLNPEVKLEAVVPDNLASATAYAILNTARGPGRSCRARVLVAPISEVIFEFADNSAHVRNYSDDCPCQNAEETLNPSRMSAAEPQSTRPSFSRSLPVTWTTSCFARLWQWAPLAHLPASQPERCAEPEHQ